MDSLKRLIPFLKPYRGRLAFSILLGLLVAVLWGGNITAVFPIVNLLLDRQPLDKQVAENIAEAEVEGKEPLLVQSALAPAPPQEKVLQAASIISGAALSSAVVRDMVPAQEAASLMGYIAMAMAIAPMLGPMFGGGTGVEEGQDQPANGNLVGRIGGDRWCGGRVLDRRYDKRIR